MLDVTLWGAFIGGLVVFFSPCVLPIVPFYLSYMAGVGVREISEDGALASGARLRLVATAVMFSLGMMTVFTLFGASAFALSSVFREHMDVFRYVAAGIVVLIGLHFLGVYRIGLLDRSLQLQVGDARNMTVLSAYVVGFAFMAGWTPCVGGVLTGVLMMASAHSPDPWSGLVMLLVFGAGMVLPFIIAALFTAPFMQFAGSFRRHLGKMEKVMGLLLLVFAALILTNSINLIAQWMLEHFPLPAALGGG